MFDSIDRVYDAARAEAGSASVCRTGFPQVLAALADGGINPPWDAPRPPIP